MSDSSADNVRTATLNSILMSCSAYEIVEVFQGFYIYQRRDTWRHYLLSALANGFNHIEKLSKNLLFALPSFGERRISPFYDSLGTFTRINCYYYHDAPCRS